MVEVGADGCSISWGSSYSSLPLDVDIFYVQLVHLVVKGSIEPWSPCMTIVYLVAVSIGWIETPRNLAAASRLSPATSFAFTLLLVDSNVSTVLLLLVAEGATLRKCYGH